MSWNCQNFAVAMVGLALFGCADMVDPDDTAPQLATGTVRDRESAIQIASRDDVCGMAVNPPAADHPMWGARLDGDKWYVWLSSDRARKPNCPLVSVHISSVDGQVSNCFVCIFG